MPTTATATSRTSRAPSRPTRPWVWRGSCSRVRTTPNAAATTAGNRETAPARRAPNTRRRAAPARDPALLLSPWTIRLRQIKAIEDALEELKSGRLELPPGAMDFRGLTALLGLERWAAVDDRRS